MDWKEDVLEKMLDAMPEFKKYDNRSAEFINFTLHFTAIENVLVKEANGFTVFENKFKMVSPRLLSMNNMYAFNKLNQITKYETPIDIINDYYNVRLEYYSKRKDAILAKSEFNASILENKRRFINEVVTEKIRVHNWSKKEFEDYLLKEKYMKFEEKFDYITHIPVYNFTKDKVDELENEVKGLRSFIKSTKAKTIQTMWLEDLDILMKSMDIKANISNNKKIAKKSGGNNQTSDEELDVYTGGVDESDDEAEESETGDESEDED
jgi:DNA topoisomerase-2